MGFLLASSSAIPYFIIMPRKFYRSIRWLARKNRFCDVDVYHGENGILTSWQD